MSLIDKINRMEEIGAFAARLRASPFTLVDEVDYEPEEKPVKNGAGLVSPRSVERMALSNDDVAHLTFAHRHGMPVHHMEVTALMESFYKDGDAATLRRAIAMIEHLIELSTP